MPAQDARVTWIARGELWDLAMARDRDRGLPIGATEDLMLALGGQGTTRERSTTRALRGDDQEPPEFTIEYDTEADDEKSA